MSSNTVALIILIINTLIAAGVFIRDRLIGNGTKSYVRFVVIFFCPVIGIAFFAGAYLLERYLLGDEIIDYASTSFDTSRHVKKTKGDFHEEVDILPLEEAFTVSEKKDRRQALLSTLKKDFRKNISTVLLGLDNEDSETSHYAASVVMSVMTDYLNILGPLREKYEASKDYPEPAREYMEALKEFVGSNIMDAVDMRKYAKVYLDVLDFFSYNFKSETTEEDFVFALNLLVSLDDYESASRWSERAMRIFPDNDSIYYNTMKMHYYFGNTQRFLELLDYVSSSNMSISNETLQTIRFMTYK